MLPRSNQKVLARALPRAPGRAAKGGQNHGDHLEAHDPISLNVRRRHIARSSERREDFSVPSTTKNRNTF